MRRNRSDKKHSLGRGLLVWSLAALWAMPAGAQEFGVDHSDCAFFGARNKEYTKTGHVYESRRGKQAQEAFERTRWVSSKLNRVRLASHEAVPVGVIPSNVESLGTIDRNLFTAMREAGIAPAGKTNDYEFARRASLDLIGRVPTPQELQRFVADPDPQKRAKYVEELLSRSEWVDKWTMYFGDLLKNNSRNTQLRRFPEGRNAFHNWIKASLEKNKPYDQMARELIAARGGNSYEQGELNFLVGSLVTGGPNQDIWDQQAADVAETFLGLGQMTCLLCHNGRGHLDSLSLWGRGVTRLQAYQLSAFFTQNLPQRVFFNPDDRNLYQWSLQPAGNRTPGSYALNTTTGNRPPRTPIGSTRTVAPEYLFSGKAPRTGENYTEFLAKEITADLQFARAAVNYIWKEFMGLGIVEPVNQFDPARLDPENPPPDPWKLQPTNARLLNDLAKDFQASGFDLKKLMRQIVTSEAYQLSSHYDPEKWNPSMEPYFARHIVRRLWAEEIHDNIAQITNVIPSYNVRTFGTVNWAMQLPETQGLPGGQTSAFLDSFQRGNRDEEPRGNEVSTVQALSLMNDNYVVSRIRATGSGARASLLQQNINRADDQLVTNLFVAVLSRPPSREELELALGKLRGLQGNARTQAAEDLLWSLFNKVDFLFNY